MLSAKPRVNTAGQIVGILIALALPIAGIGYSAGYYSQGTALQRAELNDFDARIDRIEENLFGGSMSNLPQSMKDIEGRLQAAEIAIEPAPLPTTVYDIRTGEFRKIDPDGSEREWDESRDGQKPLPPPPIRVSERPAIEAAPSAN